ncbi:MAG TPA: sigma-70 family RNA polymerase sigma factor [Vicinamibacterales bacterium]|nr:sigma-70 family RNA polymerase sigma factor [Vicinamibacterales bacterium]
MAVLTNQAGQGGSGVDTTKAEYATLVRAAAAGDRAAMERLLMRAQEVAFRFSLLACGHAEDAEDVMQDALLKTYQHVSRISDPEAFRTWLFTTVRNACLMKRRRRAGEPVRFESIEQGSPALGDEYAPIDVADSTPGVDQRMIDERADARFRGALRKLRPEYRVVLLLREMEGLPTKDVAAITGYSEANVKQRLRRARLMIRRELAGGRS